MFAPFSHALGHSQIALVFSLGYTSHVMATFDLETFLRVLDNNKVCIPVCETIALEMHPANWLRGQLALIYHFTLSYLSVGEACGSRAADRCNDGQESRVGQVQISAPREPDFWGSAIER